MERITLEDIGALVEDKSTLREIGDCSITKSLIGNTHIIINFNNEKRKIKTDFDPDMSIRDGFLTFVNKYLAENKLYLTDIYYRPHKIEGNLYQENPTSS